MNAQEFCYWLNGFVELTQGHQPTPEQWKSIVEHLRLVFTKVTPEINKPKDGEPGYIDLQELLDRIKQNQPLQVPKPRWPITGPGDYPKSPEIWC